MDQGRREISDTLQAALRHRSRLDCSTDLQTVICQVPSVSRAIVAAAKLNSQQMRQRRCVGSRSVVGRSRHQVHRKQAGAVTLSLELNTTR
jgi:hypothetical protein